MVKVHLDINSEDLDLSISRFDKIKETVLNETSEDLKAELKKNSPVDNGILHNSWDIFNRTNETRTIKSSANYAEYVNSGTGLYGPYKQKIYPKNGKLLGPFKYKGRKIAVPWTRGIKPRKFVEKSIRNTKSRLDDILIKSCRKVDS